MQEELHFTLTHCFFFSFFRDGNANTCHVFRHQVYIEIEYNAKYVVVVELLLTSAFSVLDQWCCWYSGRSVWVGSGVGVVS